MRPSVHHLCVQKGAPIPAVVSQNFTDKGCLVCAMSEEYAFLVTLSQTAVVKPRYLRILDFKPIWTDFQKANQTATEQGKAKLGILDFKTT